MHDIEIPYDDFIFLAGSDVRGRLLEDIVISDMLDIIPENCSVAKLKLSDNSAEYDIAVFDKRDARPQISLFEIKHSNKPNTKFTKYLRDENVINLIEKTFNGKVIS